VPTAAVQAREHDGAHGGLEQAMSLTQGVVKARALLQFRFVQLFPLDNYLGGLAASRAHSFDFIGDASRAADREGDGTFG
jgi:hypothetical protein